MIERAPEDAAVKEPPRQEPTKNDPSRDEPDVVEPPDEDQDNDSPVRAHRCLVGVPRASLSPRAEPEDA